MKIPEFSGYNRAVSSAEVIWGYEINIGRDRRCVGSRIKSKLTREM